MLLAREAACQTSGLIELNGPFGLELGSYGDLLNLEDTGYFEIGIHATDNQSVTFAFRGEPDQRYATVEKREMNESFVSLSSVPRALQYVSAERLGPRVLQGSAALPASLLEVGSKGEYCAQILAGLGGTQVDAKRRYGGDDQPPLLKAQTEAWLSQVTRPIQLDTENFPNIGVFSLKFRTEEEWIKPTNMGFGISYALPIIVAGLIAPEGALLIVENPEAHLHPAGQSQMGVFLSSIASAGVQVLLETHSDHVLNGVRRAVSELGVLRPESAIAHYFDINQKASIKTLHFSSAGNLNHWPSGFFDQYQLDVQALTKVRRKRP